MTKARLVLAFLSASLEEVAIFAIWRWLLPEFGIGLPVAFLIGLMAVWAVFSVTLFMVTSRILKKQVMVGLPTMVGSRGRVASSLVPEGLVKIKNELWGATSAEGNLDKGEEVEVVGENGLKLVVRKAGASKPTR